MPGRWIAVAGALLAGMAVAAGAYHSHGLDDLLKHQGWSNASERMEWFNTAAKYQMFHALACVAVAGLAGASPTDFDRAAAGLFLAGIVLFCGSLYAMTFLGDNWRKLGAVTPLGGVALLLGWLFVAIAAWRR